MTPGKLTGNIEQHIGSSKSAFIDGQGNVVRSGNFIEERGIQYSSYGYRSTGMRTCADPRLWRVAM